MGVAKPVTSTSELHTQRFEGRTWVTFANVSIPFASSYTNIDVQDKLENDNLENVQEIAEVSATPDACLRGETND